MVYWSSGQGFISKVLHAVFLLTEVIFAQQRNLSIDCVNMVAAAGNLSVWSEV